MLTLPPVLGALAEVSLKRDNSPRYSVGGVHVTATDDGWTAAATDLKRLVWVTGDHPTPAPEFPALAAAPNGATTGIIPAQWWTDVFAVAKKQRNSPGVGLVLSDKVATAAAGTTASTTELSDGKFPAIQQIIPKRAEDIGCVVHFDAHLMADTLKAMAAMGEGGDVARVTLEVRRPNGPKASDKPLIIKLANPAAGVREATALVMPLGVQGENDADSQSTKFFGSEMTAERFADGIEFQQMQAARDVAVEEYKTLQSANAELELTNGKLRAELQKADETATSQGHFIAHLRAEADAALELVTRFKDETQHGDELIGLWGRVGAAEQTARDAVAESERLRAELDAVRADRDKLLADVELLRSRPATAPRPTPVGIHHRPAATPGVRRTLGELAAMAKAGE